MTLMEVAEADRHELANLSIGLVWCACQKVDRPGIRISDR
jgi:hypothetical protein